MSKREYIGMNTKGYAYNAKYPPSDGPYDGYHTPNESILFYDFAVLGYDLQFKYQDKWYYFMNDEEYSARTDENFTIEYERFNDPMAALEQYTIDGKNLIELIQELEDAEPM